MGARVSVGGLFLKSVTDRVTTIKLENNVSQFNNTLFCIFQVEIDNETSFGFVCLRLICDGSCFVRVLGMRKGIL